MRSFGLVGLLIVMGPSAARADQKQECLDAYKQAQLSRNSRDHLSSRDHLLVCASESCPKVGKQDCLLWLGENARLIASIVVSVTDERGAPVSGALVLVDGAVVATGVDARPVELTPGVRRVGVIVAGARLVEREVTILEGEKKVPVGFVIADPKPPPVVLPPPSRTVPVGVVVLGAVAALGVGGFISFGLLGNARKDTLEACRPRCDPNDVDVVRDAYFAGDISLAVGAAAAIGAVTWAVFRLKAKQPHVAHVALLPGGFSLSIAGDFKGL